MPALAETATLPELTSDELVALLAAPDSARGGHGGAAALKAARVLCVGTGGLGSPLALYLAAAGIGTLGLVDFDVVDAEQPAAADPSLDPGYRPEETGFGRGEAQGAESRAQRGEARHHAHQRQRPRHLQGLRHRGRRHGQLSDALSGQRRLRAAGQAQRLWIDLPIRGAGERVCHRTRGRATGASIPSRRRRGWCRAARRAAYWAFCRGWWA